MRVGIDASNARSGGTSNYLRELISAFDGQAHGFDDLVVWGSRSFLKGIPNRNAVTPVREAALERSLPHRVLWQLHRLPTLASQCNVLFTPTASLLGWKPCPIVTASLNLLPFDQKEAARFGWHWNRLKMKVLRKTHSRALQEADGVVFLTNYARRTIMPQLARKPPRRVAVIPFGVNPRFRSNSRRFRGLMDADRARPFRLLYVSTIDAYKHHVEVAEAVAILRRAGYAIELAIVGGEWSPAKRLLDRAVRRLDPERKWILLRGAVPFDEVSQAYTQADGFVFASSCENLPNILLEAMASGLPIACSNVGPMPEVLGDAGAYFDPDQPEMIARVVAQTFGSAEECERLGRLAASRAERFTWQNCAANTFAFLRACADEEPAALRHKEGNDG